MNSLLKSFSTGRSSQPYNGDNLKLLFDNYPSAAGAITTAYYNELLGNREKN
ncbi:Domain of uncharacterised function (DUF1789) [Providencia alcalifaciens]|nr:Domain of uncharacterised function (DUF1789) [Providencia alcalifaciens]